MTRDETKQILVVLRSAYPSFYRGIADADLRGIVDLWSEMFRDEPLQVVAVAVKAMIASRASNFPPSIGEIKDYIVKIRSPEEMTEAEAWGMVLRATRNSLYNSQAEFDKLPPLVQRLVGSPAQLRDWAMMDSDAFASVVASNFQRAYRTRAASDREFAKLPSDVKQLISTISDKMTLTDGAQNNRQYITHDAVPTALERKAIEAALMEGGA